MCQMTRLPGSGETGVCVDSFSRKLGAARFPVMTLGSRFGLDGPPFDVAARHGGSGGSPIDYGHDGQVVGGSGGKHLGVGDFQIGRHPDVIDTLLELD